MNTTAMIEPGYGIVQTSVMRDPNLTPQAKAIYSLLASMAGKKNEAWPSLKNIGESMAMSKPTVIKYLDELEDAELIKREPLSNEPMNRRNKYLVLHRLYPEGKDQLTSKVKLAKPSLYKNNNKENNNKENRSPYPLKKGGSKLQVSNSVNKLTTEQVDEAFKEFYSAYPRKEAKKAARKKFETALKMKKDTPTPQQIIEGAMRYASWCDQTGQRRKYIAIPTTWLNQGRWEDELDFTQDNREKEAKDYGLCGTNFK